MTSARGRSRMFSTKLAASLQFTKIGYQTRYLFVENEPDPASIVVTKFIDGSGEAITIPMDPDNGWTYAGFKKNVYAIDFPIEMSQASGWAIELHGDAKLPGDDRADVQYRVAGVIDSTE